MTEHSGAIEHPTDDNPGGPAEARRAATRSVTPRNAASLILWRQAAAGPEVLMGLRHASHRFMPNVLVFPGGRVDRPDHRAAALSELPDFTRACLERQAAPSLARAIGIAAARELHEETGLVLGRMDGHRLLPELGVVEYLCRAVTPPNRFRRFNARFLIAPGEAAQGALKGSGELEELRYFSFEEAFGHKIATITAKVLAEFQAWLALSPAEREVRALVCFRGMDSRTAER
ncbi:NUDIX domain-containing protein [Paeniroseomonas aquatica]|uniref:NUDIX domain-containing protein n=1 Tax=Paeniroseomonas aquatica TaxID=373043 RepID=A0ABT8A5W9_9PROT|nr:NUDIX domain-containing protein [Paeniroseomonas aquatica]MDN3564928.1 NUDIX domain-containing protein [Paeniroseomonas aquatica]